MRIPHRWHRMNKTMRSVYLCPFFAQVPSSFHAWPHREASHPPSACASWRSFRPWTPARARRREGQERGEPVVWGSKKGVDELEADWRIPNQTLIIPVDPNLQLTLSLYACLFHTRITRDLSNALFLHKKWSLLPETHQSFNLCDFKGFVGV